MKKKLLRVCSHLGFALIDFVLGKMIISNNYLDSYVLWNLNIIKNYLKTALSSDEKEDNYGQD